MFNWFKKEIRMDEDSRHTLKALDLYRSGNKDIKIKEIPGYWGLAYGVYVKGVILDAVYEGTDVWKEIFSYFREMAKNHEMSNYNKAKGFLDEME
jgi:hypothetical protein